MDSVLFQLMQEAALSRFRGRSASALKSDSPAQCWPLCAIWRTVPKNTPSDPQAAGPAPENAQINHSCWDQPDRWLVRRSRKEIRPVGTSHPVPAGIFRPLLWLLPLPYWTPEPRRMWVSQLVVGRVQNHREKEATVVPSLPRYCEGRAGREPGSRC